MSRVSVVQDEKAVQADVKERAEQQLYCFTALARHRRGAMATFMVVVSHHVSKPAEKTTADSGLGPIPSLCLEGCSQCGCSLLLFSGLLEGSAPQHSL